MIYWAGGSQSFTTISDNNSHDPAAIWAHLIPIIKIAKHKNPLLKVIHFYSDGPCTQYRQKKNFFLHNFFTFKLGLEYSTWSFTESGHGKSVADGIGGAVKRSLDKQVAYGKDISNGEQAVELLSNSMKSVKCLYVINSDIENVAKLVPSDLTPLTGTMQIHQIIANSPGIIQYRSLSCFCGLKRGLCDCFGLNTHTYGKSTKKTELNRSNPSNKVTVTAEIHEVPISQKTKIATCSSTQKYFEQNEDIIELDIERDEGKYKEEQERVEEINDATFKTKEEEKNRLEEVNDGVTVGCKDKEQDKLEETINANPLCRRTSSSNRDGDRRECCGGRGGARPRFLHFPLRRA
ncbi:unnamed protein product [Spodoptera exigua]|nr:unnamed protein product [Spodoptera exigua]